MEYPRDENRCLENCEADGHIINVTREIGPSSSASVHIHDSSNASHILDVPSRGVQSPSVPSPSTSLASNTRPNILGREDNNDQQRQRSPLNSGLWISFELVIVLGQIIAAIIVLSISRKEKPRTPLFAWVLGYTFGCFATLPHLYWRYTHRRRGAGRDLPHVHLNSSNGTVQASNAEENANTAVTSSNAQNTGDRNRRLDAAVDQFKMALDFFFAIWFVVGNVWVFGHSSSSDAPNLYRLCIVFLIFSCIGYAMPLILCVTICCCFPCITSFLVSQEDLVQYRGARSELIEALPTYKFKSKRSRGKGSDTCTEGLDEGGIVAAGTDKERTLSAEDAVCCICLSGYVDKDELRELGCSHLFHKKCIDEWLKRNALCPLCKSSIREAASTSQGNFNFRTQ